jgi:hypothetical protein
MIQPQPAPSTPLPNWESFYANYRKPGYVTGFEITSKLGGGVFGLVFKATRQSIGKDYAIKFLKVDDGEIARAVLHELDQVRYFAQIDHPNLVSIEDKGEVDGIPYLVMAYAGAETLQDRLPGKPADRAENLRYLLQACRGVAALHERSLVHFDLKPANVFLKGSVARVGDYGLSKLVTQSRGSLSMGRGTPYYMAPELLQRRGDPRSDIYSLGVMLYEVLTGELPFKGDSEWEVLRQHETGKAQFPAHIGARERQVIERCLEKDPAHRFQSVHDLMLALGAPQGAGAAALRDPVSVAGPGAGVAAQGAGESAKPHEDPYAGFRKASREAYTHAGKIAREAMQHARVVANEAAQNARKAMRAAMDGQRHKHLRRFAAWRRLHQSKRERARRERDAVRAAKLAERQARRRPLGFVWMLGGFAAVFVVVAFALMPARMGVAVEPTRLRHQLHRQFVCRRGSSRSSRRTSRTGWRWRTGTSPRRTGAARTPAAVRAVGAGGAAGAPWRRSCRSSGRFTRRSTYWPRRRRGAPQELSRLRPTTRISPSDCATAAAKRCSWSRASSSRWRSRMPRASSRAAGCSSSSRTRPASKRSPSSTTGCRRRGCCRSMPGSGGCGAGSSTRWR